MIAVELRVGEGLNTASKNLAYVCKRLDAGVDWSVRAGNMIAPIGDEECFGLFGVRQSRGEVSAGKHAFESNVKILLFFHLEYRRADDGGKSDEQPAVSVGQRIQLNTGELDAGRAQINATDL